MSREQKAFPLLKVFSPPPERGRKKNQKKLVGERAPVNYPTRFAIQSKPVVIPDVDIQFYIPKTWFENINRLGMDLAGEVEKILGTEDSSDPEQDFLRAWPDLSQSLKLLRAAGETQHAGMTTKPRTATRIQRAAEAAGVAPHEVLLAILGSCLNREARVEYRRPGSWGIVS